MRGVNGWQKPKQRLYLNQTTVVSCDQQLPIIANKAAPRHIFESCDSLGNFLCPRGIYVYSRGCGDRISMWFRRGKVNRGNGGIFLDKDGAFERPPISRFYAMFLWGRLCMFAWDDGLVVHTVPRTVQTTTTGQSSSKVTCP